MTKEEQREKLVTTRDEAYEAWDEAYKARAEARSACDGAETKWYKANNALLQFDKEK